MKIGLITNMMDGQNTGIGRYTENLVINLLSIDKENEYFLIHSNKKKYSFEGNYQEIRLPFFDSIPKKLVIGALLFEKICRDNKLDILHDLGQISPFFFKSKTKKILTIFDLSPVIFPQFFTSLTNLYTRLFPMIIKNTNQIVTISENSKTDIVKRFKVLIEKITVTYLGVEDTFKPITDKVYLELIRTKYHLPDKFILFVGTIEPRKNLISLLTAFSDIRKRQLDVKLVIVGKMGWLQDNILQTIEQLNIKQEVVFTGFVKDEHLPAIYSLAKVFVYPSLYEGFGLPVLEAMACGCPVITSDTSSLPEIVGNTTISINSHREREIISAIMDVTTKRYIWNKLSIGGIKRARKFSWQKTARQTLKIYEDVL